MVKNIKRGFLDVFKSVEHLRVKQILKFLLRFGFASIKSLITSFIVWVAAFRSYYWVLDLLIDNSSLTMKSWRNSIEVYIVEAILYFFVFFILLVTFCGVFSADFKFKKMFHNWKSFLKTIKVTLLPNISWLRGIKLIIISVLSIFLLGGFAYWTFKISLPLKLKMVYHIGEEVSANPSDYDIYYIARHDFDIHKQVFYLLTDKSDSDLLRGARVEFGFTGFKVTATSLETSDFRYKQGGRPLLDAEELEFLFPRYVPNVLTHYMSEEDYQKERKKHFERFEPNKRIGFNDITQEPDWEQYSCTATNKNSKDGRHNVCLTTGYEYGITLLSVDNVIMDDEMMVGDFEWLNNEVVYYVTDDTLYEYNLVTKDNIVKFQNDNFRFTDLELLQDGGVLLLGLKGVVYYNRLTDDANYIDSFSERSDPVTLVYYVPSIKVAEDGSQVEVYIKNEEYRGSDKGWYFVLNGKGEFIKDMPDVSEPNM